MKNDNELDEILESIKKHKEQRDSFSVQDMPLEPPKPAPQRVARQEQKSAETNPIVPPETKDSKPKKEKKKRTPKPEKEKAPKPKKEKAPKQNNRNSETNKVKSGYGFNLKIAVVVAVSIIFAIVINQIAVYSSIGYLRQYEEKYNIEYPRGISEEFCDAYGKDQNIIGKLILPDLDKEIFISSVSEFRNSSVEYGTDFEMPQQFRAIKLTKITADLESVYSTADSFEKASQKVEFKNIYGKSKIYQVFAAYYVTTNPENDNGYLYPYNLYGDLVEKDFDHFKDGIETRSLFRTGYGMSYLRNYLTLSVDSDFMDDFRFVIVCAEVEDEVKPITTTAPNDKIQYPQVWYDKNDKHNPYWLSNGWYPEVYVDEEHTQTAILDLKN